MSSAELYDPGTGTFRATGTPPEALTVGQTATLLQDGRVLVVGDLDANAELYDPTTGAFGATGR